MGRDKLILQVFRTLKDEMRRVGRHLSFPKDTDYKKTYLYRTLDKFVSKMIDLELEVDEINYIVHLVVQYGKDNGMLNRGAHLLTMKDLLDICCERLERDRQKDKDICTELVRCKRFLDGKDLLQRTRRGGYSNLTRWYQTGDVTIPYMAVSKDCIKAMSNLPREERSELPSNLEFLKSRIKLLCTEDNRSEIAKIMGSDLFTKGV